ncbi:MAG: alpha/beta fold hydrolase [Gammaproteobacteria bacterium]|jgi:DNA-binding winged helix-turn-helix (wHTH) protein/pimeloyl-ACP methyl ester carboxylesterase|nr:alpha/beta fold hydrolase [Gammaproteobacteria bacterium]MDP6616620.1 alpha/beta fold hydrolase [Gammaproteobacteria bacterium]MDP6694817.1 alpha/beta fold hydrolase [Gammaproteobacteria bacterium]
MHKPSATSFRFAGRSLDPVLRELRLSDELREVEPKVFDLIEYLLRNRERVVSKDELQDKLWPDVVVTEASLSRAIMKARKALDDHAQEAEVIRTVPRKGFRFVADVREPAGSVFLAEGLSDVHFVENDGTHIAWRTLGEGPTDVFFAPGFVSHLDTRYRIREVTEFDTQLAKGRRLIAYDKRSVGLSERIGERPTLEQNVSDMLAVLDAAKSKRTVIFAVSESGPVACKFAAKYPDRVTALILYGTFARGLKDDDYPHMWSHKTYDTWVDSLISQWGGAASLELFAPSIANDPVAQDGWARYLRSAATPGVIRGIFEVLRDIDVRDELDQIRCPALVLHRKGDKLVQCSAGRDLAERIPGAKFVELPGQDHWWFIGDQQPMLQAMQPYLQPASDT